MTPESVPTHLVEKAARAEWEHLEEAARWMERAAELAPDPIPWEALSEASRDIHRDRARHALAAALPEVQAQALRDAADDLDLPGSTATGYYASEAVGGYNDAERDIEAWLVKRAARLTATTEEPTDG